MIKTDMVHDLQTGIPAVFVRTDDTYPLPFDRLLAAAEPVNWSTILPKRFTNMVPLGVDGDGWDRYIEHGKYAWFRHRTPLRFWKSSDDDSYRITYRLDQDADPARTDNYVRVDTGYIWVRRDLHGVHVVTEKLWAISGVSSLLASWAAPWLGWAEVTEEFFRNAAQVPPEKLVPFEPSVRPWKDEAHEHAQPPQ